MSTLPHPTIEGLMESIARMEAEIARLQQALRDATEWRPMKNAPLDGDILAQSKPNGTPIIVSHWYDAIWTDGEEDIPEEDLLGYIPIPPWKETKG